MASSFLFLFLITLLSLSSPVTPQNISLGSTLTPTGTNSSWPSPSGLFAFGFFPQNINSYAVGVFLTGQPNITVVWTANWNNPAVGNDAVLQFTRDGRLVLQQRGGSTTVTVANPSQAQPIASASMLDNGNFVLYNSASNIIWQSFDYPTDTLLPGQRLGPGLGLFSSASETDHSKGIFTLQMQGDGNLVQYPGNGPWIPQTAYYATGTNGAGTNNVSLNLDSDGYLYLVNGSSTLLRNITTGGYTTERSIYLLRLYVGGNIPIVFSSSGRRQLDCPMVFHGGPVCSQRNLWGQRLLRWHGRRCQL